MLSAPRWSRFVSVCVALGFVSIAVIGTAFIHVRANDGGDVASNPPITVQVGEIEFAQSYSIEDRFIGRIEPARETAMGFELSGRVTKINFDEGDVVTEGDEIAELDVQKLLAERRVLLAEREEVRARRDLAEVTLNRQGELKTGGWQTEQRFDEARFELAQMNAAMERLTAAIASVDVDIDKSKLRAPYSGQLGPRFVDPGIVVQAGTPVVQLLEAGVPQARIGVPVEVAAKLESGAQYDLVIAGDRFVGVLNSRRPDLEITTRTQSVIFDIETTTTLPFGEIVEFYYRREVVEDGVWVPVSALNEGYKGLWTLLTTRSGETESVVSREAVQIVHVADDQVYVTGTLQPGAAIILNGTNRVTPGQRVRVEAKSD